MRFAALGYIIDPANGGIRLRIIRHPDYSTP